MQAPGRAAAAEPPIDQQDAASTPPPGSRLAARLLAASLLLEVGRHGNRAARAVVAGLSKTAAGRVVAVHGVAEDAVARPLARALRTTALGRVAPAEREWIGRIEARRAELAASHGLTQGVFSPVRPPKASGWSGIFKPVAVSDACGVISIPPGWGLFLMRLVRELKPRSCVELGTGFGVSAAYLGAGLELNGSGRLTTLEGAEKWAAIAEQGISSLGLGRIDITVGPLSDTLEPTLAEVGPVDLAYVDADHSKEATTEYFEAILPHASDRAVIVFDDIAFDEGMLEAWIEIRSHPRVVTAASLGRMGLIRVRAPGAGARGR